MIKDLIKIIRKFYGDGEVKLHHADINGEDRSQVDMTMFCRIDCYGYAVSAFEQELAEYTGAKHVILTSSGTAAIFAIINNLEYEVAILPNYTFRGTENPFNHDAQAQEVWHIDTDENLLMDPIIQHKYSDRFMFVPVSLFGHHCNMWIDCCMFIEDACQALGTFYNGKHSGTFGKAGALSFNGNKIITTGGGGAVLTDDDELAENIREFVSKGFNLRMPALNAALGVSQLGRIERTIAKKREVAGTYQEFFERNGIRFLGERDGERWNHWLSTVVLPSKEMRDRWHDELKKEGIESRKGFEVLNGMAETPVCRELSDRVLCLPSGVPTS